RRRDPQGMECPRARKIFGRGALSVGVAAWSKARRAQENALAGPRRGDRLVDASGRVYKKSKDSSDTHNPAGARDTAGASKRSIAVDLGVPKRNGRGARTQQHKADGAHSQDSRRAFYAARPSAHSRY